MVKPVGEDKAPRSSAEGEMIEATKGVGRGTVAGAVPLSRKKFDFGC